MKNKKGFILILTLIFMTVLTIVTGSFMYMTNADMRSTAPQSDDINLTGLADAGIERAYRAIRDDYSGSALSPGSASGVADLRGGDTSLSSGSGISNATRMRYIGESSGNATLSTGTAIIRTFDSNYTNTRIISLEPHIRASRATGGQGATIQFSYTTDGTNYTILLTKALPSSTAIVDYSGTAITGLSWSQIMSPNFRLRAIRTAGNRNVNIDAMYLRVTYGIDTLKESRATGGYASFPIYLNGGAIDSITITDEQGKIHLNYASQALIQNLLTNLGISGASTKASAIVNYRGATLTNPFDSVEELQRVTGITATNYAAIRNYVTVYSFVNSNVYRPTGPRAPININTAPFEVLKSIFDSLSLGTNDASTLANAIITQRSQAPFVGFYTSASTSNNTYFYNFVRNASYLSTSGNPDEKDRVMDNGDPSILVPFSGAAAFNALTTEFCYASNTFYIETVASLKGRNLRVKTLRGNGYDPNRIRTFATYTTDAIFSGWRKENFE